MPVNIVSTISEYYDQLIAFIYKHTNDPFVLIGDQSVSVRSWIARELVSNLLAHREYSKSFNAKLIIERERIYTENWNRSNEYGRIDPENFTPQSKNPIIAKFFMNIGRADQLGSGIRNLYKYTKLYSGGEPELIEGDIFKTIIPLVSASGKQAEKTSGKKDMIIYYIEENGKVGVANLTELFGLSESRVRAILLEMVREGVIKKVGKTKYAHYVLAQTF